MDEFSLIKTYFAPLAKGYSDSLNLTDDAAIIDVPPGFELVVTKDAISEGIHFIGNEEPKLIAQKLLRTNLSDLAAMGATPLVYFLALMLPKNTGEEWIKSFAEGLAHDQKQFNIHLSGGDTIATNGTLTFSITAMGLVPKGQSLRRSGAKVGDGIYVSGTLGDSALGLSSLRAQRSNPSDLYLINRYLLPEPRIALGEALRGIASSAMDISDGLLQDLNHICQTSKVGAILHSYLIPLSLAAKHHPDALSAALSGGDDYELLVTIPKEKSAPAGLTQIGEIVEGETIDVFDENGKPLAIHRKGYRHF